jgi:hypothetical protein
MERSIKIQGNSPTFSSLNLERESTTTCFPKEDHVGQDRQRKNIFYTYSTYTSPSGKVLDYSDIFCKHGATMRWVYD